MMARYVILADANVFVSFFFFFFFFIFYFSTCDTIQFFLTGTLYVERLGYPKFVQTHLAKSPSVLHKGVGLPNDTEKIAQTSF